MGVLTPDPNKGGDREQPGGHGLNVDLGLRACPRCRREVPEWRDDCPDCGVQAVPKGQLGSVMPDIPAHLLADEDEADDEQP